MTQPHDENAGQVEEAVDQQERTVAGDVVCQSIHVDQTKKCDHGAKVVLVPEDAAPRIVDGREHPSGGWDDEDIAALRIKTIAPYQNSTPKSLRAEKRNPK